MRRWLALFSALTALGVVAVVLVSAASSSQSARRGVNAGKNFFAVSCGFSHMNTDDMIIFPGQPGLSHHHTYFGNKTTNASSTVRSLRRARSTTCSIRYDTAAYWAPTLHLGADAVEPRGATIYYRRKTMGRVQPPPFGLKLIAGNARATSPQGLQITSWSCTRRAMEPSTTVPMCPEGSMLRLTVHFPSCWDGKNLDSADHKSHLAYAVERRCPETHPVAVPSVNLNIRYPVRGGPDVSLASGGQLSGHADFVNAWNQRVLTRLVNRHLNRGQ